MWKKILVIWVVSLSMLTIACHCKFTNHDQVQREPDFAEPIKIDMVFNLYKVDANLYRSSAPDSGIAMKNIEEKLGVKTIITLQRFHDDHFLTGGRKFKLIHIPIDTNDPNDNKVIEVMKIFKNSKDGPFLIHCYCGSDRTGLMVAMYRIIHQDWGKDKAIKEMRDPRYGLHEQTSGKKILEYLQNLDNERIANIRAAIN